MRKALVSSVIVRLPPIFVVLGLLGAWWCLASITNVPGYVFPSPVAVADAAASNARLICKSVAVTTVVALTGLVGGLAAAFVSASVMAYWRNTGSSFALLLVGIQSVPVIALAPYFLIWFGPGYLGRVLMALLIVYVPASLILWNGLRRVDRDVGTLLQAFSVPRPAGFVRYRLPYSVPFVVAAVEVTASLAMIGAIVAELAGAENGVGALILRASYSMRIDLVFATLIASAVVAAMIYTGAHHLTERIKRIYALEAPAYAI